MTYQGRVTVLTERLKGPQFSLKKTDRRTHEKSTRLSGRVRTFKLEKVGGKITFCAKDVESSNGAHTLSMGANSSSSAPQPISILQFVP